MATPPLNLTRFLHNDLPLTRPIMDTYLLLP